MNMSNKEELIWAIIFLILMITAVVSVITNDDKPKAKPLNMDYSKKMITDSIVRDTQLDYFWKIYGMYKINPPVHKENKTTYYSIDPIYFELKKLREEYNNNNNHKRYEKN